MNAVQQQFHDFILDRVQDNKKEEAKALLAEAFGKQDDGSFHAMYLAGFVPKMVGMLKPEFINEVKGAVEKFAGATGTTSAADAITGVAGNLLSGFFGAGKESKS